MSMDLNFLNDQELLKSLDNKSEEDIEEMQVLVNYKQLYEIVDLAYNYEYDNKRNNKLIPKQSKLLYKNNLYNYNKYYKLKSDQKITHINPSLEKGKQEESPTNKKEKKDEVGIRIEDFYKSVMNTYEEKNVLFLWYEEVKFFKEADFLKVNLHKEANNLCNFIFESDNNKKSINNNNNFQNTIKNASTVTRPGIMWQKADKDLQLNELMRKSKTNI
jgi:hypothetical protein